MALDKNKALETALGQIEKQFGQGAIMKLASVEFKGKADMKIVSQVVAEMLV